MLLLRCSIFCVLFLLAGCSRQSQVDRALKNADKHFQSGQYEKAEIEYLRVLKLNATNAAAVRNLGAIYYADERTLHAINFLNAAYRLNPEDVETRARRTRIFLSAGALKEARQEAEFVLQRSPTNETALLAIVEMAFKPDEIKAARSYIDDLKKRAGDQPIFKVTDGYLSLRENNRAAAESSFKAAAAADPKLALAHWALGSLYQFQTNQALAEAAFQTAADLSPPRSNRRMKMVALRLQAGDLPGAKKILEEILSTAPDYLPAWVYSARIAMQEKNFPKVESDLNRILARNPDHYEGLEIRAELLLTQGKVDKALADLERLTSRYPRSAQARYQLAVALLIKKDSTRALAALNQAVILDRNHTQAVLLLADLNTRKGDAQAAIASLTDLLKINPSLERAHIALGSAYQAAGRLNDAALTYQNLLQRFPKNTEGLIRLGLVYRNLGKNPEARKAFEAVLAAQPFDTVATTQLAELDATDKNFDAATQRIQRWIDHAPNSPEPIYQMARLAYAKGDVAAARGHLEKVIQIDNQAIAAYLMLARLYFSSGQLEQALAKAEQAFSRNSRDAGALLLIAILQSESGDFAKARDSYERLLTLTPNNAIALNNLAALYADRLNQLDKALPLARKAETLRPQDPVIADTFGWILSKRGEFNLALELLKDASQKLPSDPEILSHVGITHYLMGDEPPAKAALERALTLGTNFTGRAEAQNSLAILNISADSTSPNSRPLLEKRLAEKPADPVALHRLGSILDQSGQFPAMAAFYERALAANSKFAPAIAGLAEIEFRRRNFPKALELARQANNLAPHDATISRTASRIGFASNEARDQQWSLTLLQEVAQKLGENPDLAYDLAWAQYSQGRIDDAKTSMRAALNSRSAAQARQFLQILENPAAANSSAADTNFIPAVMARADAARQKGDLAAAQKLYELTLARFPAFTPAVRNAALVSTDPARTVVLATRARELNPEDPEIAKTLGIALLQRNEPARALRLLQESAEKLPDDPALQFNLGSAYFRANQKPQAKIALTKAVSLRPDAPFAAEAKRLLSEIK